MRKIGCLGVCLGLWVVAIPAQAQTATPYVIGLGSQYCREVTAQLQRPDQALQKTGYEAWAQGWLSATSALRSLENKPVPDLSRPSFGEQARWTWLAHYCATHPDERFWEAATMLTAYLMSPSQ